MPNAAQILQHARRNCRLFFTRHPAETGETYGEHLWFTVKMAAHFVLVALVMMVHGLFPFLLTRAASKQIEKLYWVMKGRIPKTRRSEIDAAYELDYSV
jgi:hypothetical protein